MSGVWLGEKEVKQREKEVNEKTAFMIDPRWARIWVNWDASANPRSVVVSEGDRSFVIQLWWEFQPQLMGESRMSKQNRGREIREEGDARTRARESVEQAVLENKKRMEKTKGVLHGEKEKLAEVEGQIDGISHWEEKKLKQVGEQKGQTAVCWRRMGPTSMAKERNRVRKGNNGLGFSEVVSPIQIEPRHIRSSHFCLWVQQIRN